MRGTVQKLERWRRLGAVLLVLVMGLSVWNGFRRARQLAEAEKRSSTGVVIADSAPGFQRAMDDLALQPLYKDNLALDLDLYRKGGTKRNVGHLLSQLRKAMTTSNYVGLFVIKDNRVHLFKQRRTLKFAVKRMLAMQNTMVRAMNYSGVRFPNTVFIFNAEDESLCTRVGGCSQSAPIFSLFKRWDNKDPEQDVLLPHFGKDWNKLLFYPWKSKDPRALLRASFQNSMNSSALRVQLTALAANDPKGKQYLDAGIVFNRNRREKLPENQLRKFVSMTAHAKWRFLLNTDGHTASSRFGELLRINSVVLKEQSSWIEFFYRSVHDGEHYYSFTLDNVLPLMERLSAPAMDQELQRVANASQQFAYKFLHQHSKVMYLRQALVQYNELFDDSLVRLMSRVNATSELDFGNFVRLMRAVSLRSGGEGGA